jgi:signal transduction histidine kinase/ligand-binding sensor domain-containing protein
MPVLAAGTVSDFAKGPDGTMWAGTGNGVWRLEGSSWRHLGTDWSAPAVFVELLAFDRTGTLWLVGGNSLFYLLPGGKQFRVASKGNVQFSGFTKDPEGFVMTRPITQQLTASMGHWDKQLHDYPIFRNDYIAVVDRNQGVWLTDSTFDQPLMHIPLTETLQDDISKANTGDSETYNIHSESRGGHLVDREGNSWIADEKGLYRLFYSLFAKQELPSEAGQFFAMAPDDDGAVWIGAWVHPELYHVANGITKEYPLAGVRPGWALAYRAPDKTFWFGAFNGLWHRVGPTFVRVKIPQELVGQEDTLQAIAPDRAAGLWFSFGPHGLYRLAKDGWTRYGGRKDMSNFGVISEFADNQGRVWFGCTKSQLAVLDGDRVEVFGPEAGVRVGNITALYGRGAKIWVGGEFGLQQFDKGLFHDVVAVDSDVLRGISGIVETANRDLWLNGLSGIFHISAAEIAHALTDPSYRVKGEHFGSREGVPGTPAQLRPIPSAIEGTDGRLWFALTRGVVWLDPRNGLRNASPPPVSIQYLSANDKNYQIESPLTLPAHTSSVKINYSAVSLSDPEAIRFRYKLREVDATWHEARNDRSASYYNLAPNTYHFSLSASDIDGVWSDNVSTIAFTILPGWYQTTWFRSLCACVLLLLLWIAYRLRVRGLQRQFAIGLEARLNERTRLARDLHDTFLQTIQGSKLVTDAALKQSTDASRMRAALEQLSIWLERATEEGRAAPNSLRTSTTETNDLAEALRRAIEECRIENSIESSFSVVGETKEMHPIVRDEVYRIGYEAIRNACVHSQASKLQVTLTYAEELEVRVADNGVGLDTLVADHGREGHFGLKGMRERAARIAGKLSVTSSPTSGTEVKLVVPGKIIYRKMTSDPEV